MSEHTTPECVNARVRKTGFSVLVTMKILTGVGEKHYERLATAIENGTKTTDMEADSMMMALAEAFQAGREQKERDEKDDGSIS